MSLLILVVDDEPVVETLFRQQFRRDLRSGRFTMEFAQSAPAASVMRWSAAGADWANSMVNRPARRSRRNCCRNSTSTSGSSSTTRTRRFTRVLPT